MWLNSDEAIEVISKEFDFSLWTRLLWVTTHECKLNTRFSECCCREWWEVRSEVSSTYGELRAWLRLGNRCKHLQLQHTNLCQNDVGTTTHWSHYHMRGKKGGKKDLQLHTAELWNDGRWWFVGSDNNTRQNCEVNWSIWWTEFHKIAWDYFWFCASVLPFLGNVKWCTALYTFRLYFYKQRCGDRLSADFISAEL